MRWALSRVAGGVAAILAVQLLTAGTIDAQATTGIVRGRVVEQGTNRPIGDAQVLVTGTSAASSPSTRRATCGSRPRRSRRSTAVGLRNWACPPF